MDEVEEIKRRIDIVDLVSSYLTLKKAGTSYKAICPFHQEKTPSFMVNPERQIFKCFGCNEGGDVFSFVMKMENLEFPEALKILADRAGVVLKTRTKTEIEREKPDRKTRLFAINKLAGKIFSKILLEHPSGKPALNYLKKRGLTLETIKQFEIGYAASPRATKSILTKKGFTGPEIESAGGPDRFYRRMMFPINDAIGQTIGFTGRVLDPKQEPKYLNTPDTIIFHKGRILYNLAQARGAIKQANATIVVEGQMDVIASHQAGVKNVVATSGTALTDEHLKILYRYTPNIIFCFDADSAGIKTAKKAYEMAIIEGMNVKMISLGQFKDPGEMIAADSKLWMSAVEKAMPVIDWYFEQAFSKKFSNELTSQEKKEIAREILPIIKIIPDQIEQADYVGKLSQKLNINEKTIFEALNKVKNPISTPAKSSSPSSKSLPLSAERLLIAILLYEPKKIAEATRKIAPEDLQEIEVREIYKTLQKEYNISDKEILKRLYRNDRTKREIIEALVLQAENLYQKEPEKLLEDFNEVLIHLKENSREKLKKYYAQAISQAEKNRDLDRLKVLMKEFQDALK